jgi:putative flavoprotein involved in K+ transport
MQAGLTLLLLLIIDLLPSSEYMLRSCLALSNNIMETSSFQTTPPPPPSFVETIIVGGGHCGVNLACWLQQQNEPKNNNGKQQQANYLLLERRESLLHQWRHFRWNDFQLNTPHRFSKLHGQDEDDLLPDDRTGEFFSRQLQLWDKHIEKQQLRYQTGFTVTSVTATTPNSDDPACRFLVQGIRQEGNDDDEEEAGVQQSYMASNVVICTGLYAVPTIPLSKSKLDDTVKVIHSRDFRSADQFPDADEKLILVVGGGQSGVQIADSLASSGKKVALCTSKVPGISRTYRGRDLFLWLSDMGLLTMTNEQRDAKFPPERSKAMKYGKLPIIGGTKSVSPFSLHRAGVEILGSFKDVVSDNDGVDHLEIKPDRSENVQASLTGHRTYKQMIAGWLEQHPDHGDYQDDTGDPAWDCVVEELLQEPGRLRIPVSEVQGIVWCTGYQPDFSFLRIPAAIENDFDDVRGTPKQLASAAVPGLYYSGFPWLNTFQSANLVGFDVDHELIFNKIVQEGSS